MNPLRDLQELVELFPAQAPFYQEAVHVAASQTPEPYKSLLVHDHHMTIAMEDYHKSPVEVKILASHRAGDIYCRKIILLKEGTDFVVQFGMVRFDLQYVTKQVQQDLLDEKIPLGRVLINYNILRHIDLGAIMKFTPARELTEIFQLTSPITTYGRLATIFCNHNPAVDLLEISRPL